MARDINPVDTSQNNIVWIESDPSKEGLNGTEAVNVFKGKAAKTMIGNIVELRSGSFMLLSRTISGEYPTLSDAQAAMQSEFAARQVSKSKKSKTERTNG